MAAEVPSPGGRRHHAIGTTNGSQRPGSFSLPPSHMPAHPYAFALLALLSFFWLHLFALSSRSRLVSF